jgi:prephenate dehydrogenase
VIDAIVVIGTGLIGTSVALAARREGVAVHLHDRDTASARTAEALGAGVVGLPRDRVDLAVIAVPPGRVAEVLAGAQARGLALSYTDVASVKGVPERAVLRLAPDPSAFVGGHPMAGRERSGPLAARVELFRGRPWAITPSAVSSPAAIERATALAIVCGAEPVLMSSAAHDEAVALTSHAPHLLASLMAAQLAERPAQACRLAGQGLRDVTRIAAGDPALWTQIVSANSGALTGLLEQIRGELDRLLVALGKEEAGDELTAILGQGVSGAVRVPGKHGTPHIDLVTVLVTIPDRPGQLAKLFADAAESGANVEDLRIDHSPGRPVGEVELSVKPASVDQLVDVLTDRGWVVPR